jgi:catecholate siderophore receptor
MRSKIPASLRRLPPLRADLAVGLVSGLALTGAALAQGAPAAPTQEAQATPATQGAPAAPGSVAVPPISVRATSDRDYKIDRVQSPKMTEPLLNTPKSVVVIPKEVIRDQGFTSFKDVMRVQPGISIGVAEGGNALGDRILVRGFESRNDVFVDGMRDPGVVSREVFNTEQIEIVKGPGSAYVGRGATGGSVNIVSKTPQNQTFYRADGTLGSDLTRRLTGDVNYVINDQLAVRLNALVHGQDVAGRDEVFQKRYGFAPSVTWGMNGPTRVTASYYMLRTKEMPDYGHPFDINTQRPLNVSRSNFYGLVDRDFRRTSADIGTVLFEHEFNPNWKFRSQGRYGRTTNDYVVSAPEGPNLGAGTVNSNAKNRDAVNTVLANQTDVTGKFQTWGLQHTLVTGIEVNRDRVKNRPYAIVPTSVPGDIWNPDPNRPWLGTIQRAGTFTQYNAWTVAPYIFDNIKINDQFEIAAGLRWDNYDIKTKSSTAATDGLKNKVDFLNWHLGAVYKPLPNGSIYVAYSSSSNPTGEQLDGGGADYGSIVAANQSLDPERNRSYEIGTKWDFFEGKLSTTAALFRIDKTNARINAPGGGVQVLDGKQRVDGFELGVAGRPLPEWQVFGGFTYLDARTRKGSLPEHDGKRIPNVPETSFSLWTTYDITPDITVGGLAYWTARRYGGQYFATTASIPGYWRFDLMASYRINEHALLRLNVLNIFNKTYYDAIYRSATPFAYVGAGRSALLTLSVSY